MAGERILLVEDNPLNLKLARTLLEFEGYEVLSAEDGRQALALVAQHVPALALIDIQLPGMDGLELVRRLRADPRTQGLIIVALTAYAMKGDEERFLASGCDAYFSKPLDQATFGQRVGELLATRPRKEGSAP